MEKFMDCLTDESQDVFVGGMVMVSVMMKGLAEAFSGLGWEGDDTKNEFAKLEEVMKKHGITEEFLKTIEEVKPAIPEDAIKALIKPVKDKPEFVADMFEAFDSLGDDKQDANPGNGFMGELTELKIDGDSATAVVVGKKDGKERKQDMSFKKIDGGWLIHLEVPKTMPGLPN